MGIWHSLCVLLYVIELQGIDRHELHIRSSVLQHRPSSEKKTTKQERRNACLGNAYPQWSSPTQANIGEEFDKKES